MCESAQAAMAQAESTHDIRRHNWYLGWDDSPLCVDSRLGFARGHKSRRIRRLSRADRRRIIHGLRGIHRREE